MALQLSTKSPTHDVTLTIDDEPVRAHVKRFTKDEGMAFMREFARMQRQRGTAALTDDERLAKEISARAFLEQAVTEYITFEPGDVLGDDGPIVTGAQIVTAFQFRLDVLSACYQAIYAENCLGKAQKKTLNSLRIFSPGSTPSTETPTGPAPEPTAAPAGGSSSASPAAATDDPDANGKARGSVH